MSGDLLPRGSAESSPQHLVVTLLGDYWLGAGLALPSGALVELVAPFDVTAANARAALSRLARRGVLEVSRSGRTTAYALTPQAARTIAAGEHRILSFGVAEREWNGEWTVAAFSLPEEQREVRHLLRSRLRWLGFAPLYDAVWASPHATAQETLDVLRELGVGSASVVRGREAGGRPLVDAWDLGALAAEYEQFCASAATLRARARRGRVGPAEALVRRTRLMDTWRSFPGRDPDLPAQLLPARWPRQRARELFVDLYDRLGPAAELRVREVVCAFEPALAELVHHRGTGRQPSVRDPSR